MTRGKHGDAAAVRHAVQSRDAEIAIYRRAVARLTAEKKALRAQLDEQRQAARAIERELRARLNEGLSPELEVLRRRNAALKAENEERRHVTTTLGRQQSEARAALMEALTEKGVSPFDAAKAAWQLMPMYQSPRNPDRFHTINTSDTKTLDEAVIAYVGLARKRWGNRFVEAVLDRKPDAVYAANAMARRIR